MSGWRNLLYKNDIRTALTTGEIILLLMLCNSCDFRTFGKCILAGVSTLGHLIISISFRLIILPGRARYHRHNAGFINCPTLSRITACCRAGPGAIYLSSRYLVTPPAGMLFYMEPDTIRAGSFNTPINVSLRALRPVILSEAKNLKPAQDKLREAISAFIGY